MYEGLKLKRFISIKDSGRKLGDFVRGEMNLSRRAIKTIKFKDGAFLVNGSPQNVTYLLKGNEELVVCFPPEEKSTTLQPEPLTLDVIFEDAYALIINKPAGMPTIPSYQHFTGTLANGVVHYLLDKGESGTSHPVTRLDRETSGLVLMAKFGHVHDLFSRKQKAKEVNRRYLAVVEHPFDSPSGVIESPIGRKEGSIIERCVAPDGKPALTYYKVLWQNASHAVVGIALETGRTHQIRVHFSSIGHPLVGDDLYGGHTDLLNRQALHARHLFFRHPLTEEKVFCTAPIPQDLFGLLEDEAQSSIEIWDAEVLKQSRKETDSKKV